VGDSQQAVCLLVIRVLDRGICHYLDCRRDNLELVAEFSYNSEAKVSTD
jgi:hypothetical protein